MFEVIKKFNSRTQRFSEGDRVYKMMDLYPHTIETLIHAGFVVNKLDSAPARQKPTKSADTEIKD